MSRLLTTSEQANVLWRQPVLAAEIANTKAALALYGFDLVYERGLFTLGIIPKEGYELANSPYGRVLIQPAPNGEIYFNVDYATAPGAAGAKPYVDPTPPPDCDLVCQLGKLLLFGAIAFGAAYVIGKRL